MKDWSTYWKSSSHVRKQRKYRFNAPVHIRSRFVSSHLSKDLKVKHKIRSIALRKGDTVKILRGRFKGQSAKVDVVDRKDLKVYLENMKIAKKDGTEVPIALDASNLIVTSLNLDDKRRIKSKEAKEAKKIEKPEVKKKTETKEVKSKPKTKKE
jgi:large subunit ribosomal protein L24